MLHTTTSSVDIAPTTASQESMVPIDSTAGDERRRHARHSVSRPCKVFHCPSRRYLSAKTCDLSAGGALIHLEDVRAMTPGEEVLLIVDWTGREVLPSSRMVQGTVVRVAGSIGRHQSVGVAFAEAHELSAVA